MPFSFAIVVLVLLWTWLLATRVPDRSVLAVGGAVIALAVWHNLRQGEWGVAWRALGGASRGAILLTLPGVALILAAGWALGTLHDRRDFLGSLGPLVVWGAGQQWVLQTVLLREAQRASSRRWRSPMVSARWPFGTRLILRRSGACASAFRTCCSAGPSSEGSDTVRTREPPRSGSAPLTNRRKMSGLATAGSAPPAGLRQQSMLAGFSRP